MLRYPYEVRDTKDYFDGHTRHEAAQRHAILFLAIRFIDAAGQSVHTTPPNCVIKVGVWGASQQDRQLLFRRAKFAAVPLVMGANHFGERFNPWMIDLNPLELLVGVKPDFDVSRLASVVIVPFFAW